MFTDGNCNTAPVKIDTTAEPNANIPNLAVGDVFNAGDYEVTVTSLKKGSQTLGWTGEGMVDQNLIAGVKIPMSVVFENIKINACYQYYNRGENGAVVRSKTDASWGSVVSFKDRINNINEPYENLGKEFKPIQKLLEDIKMELLVFPLNCEQKETLQKQLSDLETAKGIIENNPEYSAEDRLRLTGPVEKIISNVRNQLTCHSCVDKKLVKTGNCSSLADLTTLVDTESRKFDEVVESFEDRASISVNFVSFKKLADGSIEFYERVSPNARVSAGPRPSFIVLVNTWKLALLNEEYNYLRSLGYSETRAMLTAGWNISKDELHVLLDVAGFVPVFGEIADGLNAVVYAFEGDNKNSAFSAMSMIPVVGDLGGKGTKYSVNLVEAGTVVIKSKKFYLTKRAVERVNKARIDYGDDVADALAESFNWKRYRAKIYAEYGNLYAKWQGHHMIPRELIETSEVVRKAMAQGFDFNDVKNLIPLPINRHRGSHPEFTEAVRQLIIDIKRKGGFPTDRKVVEEALRRVKKTLEDPKYRNKKVNEITIFLQ